MNVVAGIPIYSKNLSKEEKISLEKCIMLLKCDIVFIAPQSLNVSWYKFFCSGKKRIRFERFDDLFFKDIEGYNMLLMSSVFYQRFLNYDYLFIHQLDVFIFRDELETWCSKNYDYIGAPWIETLWLENAYNLISNEILASKNYFTRIFYRGIWRLKSINASRVSVGNGGCSLRKVKYFYKRTRLNEQKKFKWKYNEDLFWSIYITLINPFFKKPSPKEALKFAFDFNPQVCFDMNKQQLPFAAHAWFRNDEVYKNNFNFWKHFITQPIS
ncbi:MAG TPA: DUF5672 family protein [Parafilimonas sp.]|nr:DUF5672 family protein [Parafilimonas sp.]